MPSHPTAIELPPMAAVRISKRPPLGLSSIELPKEVRDAMTTMALEIWTAVVNQGRPLQDAILAVYLSGLNHGMEGLDR